MQPSTNATIHHHHLHHLPHEKITHTYAHQLTTFHILSLRLIKEGMTAVAPARTTSEFFAAKSTPLWPNIAGVVHVVDGYLLKCPNLADALAEVNKARLAATPTLGVVTSTQWKNLLHRLRQWVGVKGNGSGGPRRKKPKPVRTGQQEDIPLAASVGVDMAHGVEGSGFDDDDVFSEHEADDFAYDAVDENVCDDDEFDASDDGRTAAGTTERVRVDLRKRRDRANTLRRNWMRRTSEFADALAARGGETAPTEQCSVIHQDCHQDAQYRCFILMHS
jgi:hypothetical protein